MIRLFVVVLTSIMAAAAQAAGTTLAEVKTIYLDLTLPENVAQCRGTFDRAAAEEGIALVAKDKADAMLKVGITHEERNARHLLGWTMSLTLASGQQAQAESGSESGWSAMGACSDLAEDMMEDLRDDLRNARYQQFR